MKRFIVHIIVYFLIPLGGLLGIIEYCMRQVPNDYKYKNDWLCENAQKIEVYVLGSSHTFYGIEPKQFSSSTFNGAHVSQGLKYDLFLLQKFEQSMDSLKWVILPISYFTITSKGLEYGQEKWRIKNYTIYYDCPYHRFEPEFALESYKFHPKELWSSITSNNSHMSCNEFGRGLNYARENRNEEGWKDSGITAAKRHTVEEISEDIVCKNTDYIEEIISICQKHNARLLLITTPTYQTYQENLNEEQLQIMIDVSESIATNHENVIYLNWLNHPDFTEDDFFDADHLNEYGANKLSVLLDSVISQ